MTTYYNMAGTTSPSFKIGKGGPTLFQGNYTPSVNNLSPYFVDGKPGDLFIRSGVGTSPAIFVFDNSDWEQRSDWIQNGTTTYTTSNVGIGVTSVAAGSALTVNGTIDIQGLGNGIYFPDGTFQDSSASASAAGGTDQIQFNDGSGSFAADSQFVYNPTLKRFGVGTTSAISSVQYKYTALESTGSEVFDTTPTVIDTFKVPEIRSAHYYIQITDESTSEYQISQITVVHNGLSAYKSEYNIICSANKLGEFDVELSGVNVNLMFYPNTVTHKTMKVNRSSMTI